MKTNLNIYFFLLLGVLLCSCENETNNNPNNKESEVNLNGVYILGKTSNGRASFITLWENGIEKKITDGSIEAEATSLFVYNNDVYISGYEIVDGWEVARVWKNGKIIDFAPNGSQANSIFVYNGDVYIAGNKCKFFPEKNGDDRIRYDLLVWKNGVVIKTLIKDSPQAFARSIFVSNDTAYVAGKEAINGKWVARIWKDRDILHTLSDSINSDGPRSIFVSNSDVYVAGYGYSKYGMAKLWKNGKMTELNDPNYSASANSVFVSDNNVYVAGNEEYSFSEYAAVFWKNGVRTTLSKKQAIASSIFVKNNTIYVVGFEQVEGQFATIWVNGTSKRLSNSYSSSASSVFVVK